MRRQALLTTALLASVALLMASSPAARAQKPIRHRVSSPWDVEAREYLGTPKSEQAAEKGLAFLAAHQLADGHWASGQYTGDISITALSLLAFLASGHQPGRGRYGLHLNEAVDYLSQCVSGGGDASLPPGLVRSPASKGNSGEPMYGHGFATLALAEVYGMTKRRDLKTKVESAVRLIEDTQNKSGRPDSDGGWRYKPRNDQDADLSVTVVQVLALRAARNAGIRVAQQTIDRAVEYMTRCANNPDGGFSYQVQQRASNPPRTGAGVLSLMMAGRAKSPQCQGGLSYLVKHPFVPSSVWTYREHFFYAIYYVTQAMYQAGGDYWHQWYPGMRDKLISLQETDGGFTREGYSEAGAEYATAMSVLVLQVPAGLLPIYQKL